MKRLFIYSLLAIISNGLFAQDDIPIDNSFMGDAETTIEKVFPTIQVYNLPTTAVLQKGEMKLYLAHRMGVLGVGTEGLFGLYQANSRIGADLGLTKKFTIGFGSTSQQKLYDGYVKYQITKQSYVFPVEMALFTSATITTMELDYPEEKQEAWQRMSYTSELMISRAISKKLSAQLVGAVVHKNMVTSAEDKNTIFSAGGLINVKTGRKLYLAAEYMYLPKNQVTSIAVQEHILSLGIQIHTGPRHIFQIFLSNAVGAIPGTVITETQQQFIPKNLRICFNIPTTFNLYN